MGNLKHTQGEWFACCKDQKPHFVFSKGGEVTICAPCQKQEMQDDLSDDEFRANAKLIASAHDLLAASNNLINKFGSTKQVKELGIEKELNELINAIQKATK